MASAVEGVHPRESGCELRRAEYDLDPAPRDSPAPLVAEERGDGVHPLSPPELVGPERLELPNQGGGRNTSAARPPLAISARSLIRNFGRPSGKNTSPTLSPTISPSRSAVPRATEKTRWSRGWPADASSRARCSSRVRVGGDRYGIGLLSGAKGPSWGGEIKPAVGRASGGSGRGGRRGRGGRPERPAAPAGQFYARSGAPARLGRATGWSGRRTGTPE